MPARVDEEIDPRRGRQLCEIRGRGGEHVTETSARRAGVASSAMLEEPFIGGEISGARRRGGTGRGRAGPLPPAAPPPPRLLPDPGFVARHAPRACGTRG